MNTKTLTLIMTSLLALGLFSWLFSPQSGGFENQGSQGFAEGLKAHPNAYLLDVRTAREFEGGHLPKATNLDVTSSSFSTAIAKLDTSRPVYVYCRSGARSAKAAGMLSKQGFTHVVNLQGGIMGWQGPVVR